MFLSLTRDKRDLSRNIRVFISSTFRDMHEEREELVKRIFPKLRKTCEERGVTWGEVDLRWGITDEQKAEGQVLPICLQEIDRCRPYFIGILGELYGWIPDEFPQDLVEQEPWLVEHHGKSVTELEIIHGVLNNPDMADHAFFYFRDPEYVASIPEEKRINYQELPLEEDIRTLGKDEAEKRAKTRQYGLEQLKEQIRKSNFPVRENYRNPQDFAELVLKDITEVINKQFPLSEKPSPLERETQLHKAFAVNHVYSYVPQQVYIDRINTHIVNDDLPLVITADSGSGKTALLAYWISEYAQKNVSQKQDHSMLSSLGSFLNKPAGSPEKIPLIYHFVSATPTSNDWIGMLRHIMGEMKKECTIAEDIPEDIEKLRSTFTKWLFTISDKGRMILVIEALDELRDYGGAQDLTWLPVRVPSNIRLIVTTQSGKPLDELKKRGWPILKIVPLNVDERKDIIKKYLNLHSKRLPENIINRIAMSAQTSNALFLCTFLNEIRLHGDHTTLIQKIDYYLSAQNNEEIFEKLLERYEQDYDRDRPNLVRDTMSYIWASRNGLYEAELRNLLGTEDELLPQAFLSPLFLALENSLVNSAGLFSISHTFLRQAVQHRYASTEKEQENLHNLLATYFRTRVLNARQVEELPWQLSQAKLWNDLAEILKDPLFFIVLADDNKFELGKYWGEIEEHSAIRFKDTYIHALDNPSQYPDAFLWYLAEFLVDKGYLKESLALQKYLSDRLKSTGPNKEFLSSLNRTAQIYYRQGNLIEALRLYEEEWEIRQKYGIEEGIPALLGNIALIYRTQGETSRAFGLFDEEERICRKIGDKKNIAAALGNKATIRVDEGDFKTALALLEEAEIIGKETDDRGILLGISINRANIFLKNGDLNTSSKLYQDVESAARDLGSNEFLVSALEGQAQILIIRGDPRKARTLLEETVTQLNECGDFNTALKVQGDLAEVCYHLGEREKSEAIYQDILKRSREIHYSKGIGCALGNLAIIFKDKGFFDEALAMQKEHEHLCMSRNDHYGTAVSLMGQGSLFQAGGHPADALRCYSEAERILRNLNAFEALATCLINKGLLLAQDYNQPQQGLHYAREAYGIASEHGFTRQAREIIPLITTIQQQEERVRGFRSGYNDIVSGTDDEILFLKDQLLSPGWETFEHAANTLGHLAKTAPEKILLLIPKLIEDLYSVEDRVASGAAFALTKISEQNRDVLVPSTQDLLKFLEYTKTASNYEIIGKRSVIFVLGKSGVRNPSLVIPLLKGFINDPDEYVRKNAKEALEELSGHTLER